MTPIDELNARLDDAYERLETEPSMSLMAEIEELEAELDEHHRQEDQDIEAETASALQWCTMQAWG